MEGMVDVVWSLALDRGRGCVKGVGYMRDREAEKLDTRLARFVNVSLLFAIRVVQLETPSFESIVQRSSRLGRLFGRIALRS